MASLAVNTLLQSHHSNDLEGGAGSIAFDATPLSSLEEMVTGRPGAAASLASYDETALCSVSFRIMKTMVHYWLKDVTDYSNVLADYQMIHFYRWLRSPSALLYDPALRRTLQNLMKKLFLHLIAEFKRLGSNIVQANFNRIILCTKKRRIVDAIAYVDFITSSIKSKNLFHGIELTYKQCWEVLVWLDPANHGGIKGRLPRSLEEGEEDSEMDTEGTNLDQEDEEPEVEMNWNIMHYLPAGAACQDTFNMVVAGYILAVYKNAQEESNRMSPGNTPIRRRGESQPTQADASSTPNVVSFAQNLVEGELSQKLFAITQKIQRKLSGNIGYSVDASKEFPQLPGSYLPLNNPSLEFVKAICKVLALDPNITIQVSKLKRNLLKLINVGEFADAAQWVDPCLTYVLPEIICKVCNHCRDLDLCRDPLLEHDGTTASLWHCEQCDSEYDVEVIEGALVEAVNRASMAFTLQDLTCTKCHQVKMQSMARYCECAGDFDTTLSPKVFIDKMKTFSNLAKHYNMVILGDTVDWILGMNASLVK